MSIYNFLYKLALKAKEKTFHLNYGREIIKNWCIEYINKIIKNSKNIKILDIGCGKGDDLINILNSLESDFKKRIIFYGIEYNNDYLKECKAKGIKCYRLNIERDVFPFKAHFFDIVIINQVTEHLKEIFYVYSEISRVLKYNGVLIVGFPNLAAYYDRFSLLLGEQPTCIKLLGPHIRGLTYPGFKSFIECEGYFKIEKIKGAGFYPFSEKLSKILAEIFPTFSNSLFFKIKRTNKKGLFINVLKNRFFETNFYKGRN